jgi:hypothetical protein
LSQIFSGLGEFHFTCPESHRKFTIAIRVLPSTPLRTPAEWALANRPDPDCTNFGATHSPDHDATIRILEQSAYGGNSISQGTKTQNLTRQPPDRHTPLSL